MTGKDLRGKRAVAGITGYAVCQVASIARARLSDIERENVAATPQELVRINEAIEEIVRSRQQLAKLAAEAGLSLAGVRL